MYSNVVWEEYTVHCFPISESVSLIYNSDRREWVLRQEQDASLSEEDDVLVEDDEQKIPDEGVTAFGVHLSLEDFLGIKDALYSKLNISEREDDV